MTRLLAGYQAGINLGHWLSQNDDQPHAYLDSYMQQEDIARIASWGWIMCACPSITLPSKSAPSRGCS